MPRPVRPWFRVYTEIVGDRKIRRLKPAERWVWVAIMAAARESPTPGELFIAEGEPMTVEELADYADVKEREVRSALDAMVRLGMVTISGAGVIAAPNFSRRQYESDNVTARTRSHRERSKPVDGNDVGTFQRGSQERDGNGPETETETETEQKTSSSEPRKRATRLTEDWKPTGEDIAWQRGEGIDDIFARRELVKFVNYWMAKSGKDATKLDWSRTWRNWLMTARERLPQRPAGRNEDDPMGWAR